MSSILKINTPTGKICEPDKLLEEFMKTPVAKDILESSYKDFVHESYRTRKETEQDKRVWCALNHLGILGKIEFYEYYAEYLRRGRKFGSMYFFQAIQKLNDNKIEYTKDDFDLTLTAFHDRTYLKDNNVPPYTIAEHIDHYDSVTLGWLRENIKHFNA